VLKVTDGFQSLMYICSVCCSCSRVRKWEVCLDHSEKKNGAVG